MHYSLFYSNERPGETSDPIHSIDPDDRAPRVHQNRGRGERREGV
jgi:hypothetical protein